MHIEFQQTAKLFQNGMSQAVRLPKEYRFEGKEVYIEKKGDKIILSPKPRTFDEFFRSGPKCTGDFMARRVDPPLQKRKLFDE